MANEDSPNAAAPKAELIAGVTMSRRGKVSRVIPAPAIDFAAVLSNANDNKSISVLYGADRDTAGRALITISEIKGASFSSDGRWTLNGVIARGQKLLLQEGASTTVPSLRESVFAIGGREVVGGSSRPGILLLRKRDSQWFEQWLPIGETFTPGPVAIARSSDNSISVYFERVPVDSIETGRGIYVLRHSLTGSHKSKLELVKSVPSSAGIMRPRVVHLPNGAQHVFWVEVSRTDVKPIAYIAHAWRTPADTVWRTNSHVLKHGSVAFFDLAVNSTGAIVAIVTGSGGELSLVDVSNGLFTDVPIQGANVPRTFWSFDFIEMVDRDIRFTWSVPPVASGAKSNREAVPSSMTGVISLVCRP